MLRAAFFALALASAAADGVAPPCADEPGRSAPWCDPSRALDARAAALVANLTLEEKSGLLVNAADGVPRLNLAAYNWWSEALHGVARDGLATSWPQARARATPCSARFSASSDALAPSPSTALEPSSPPRPPPPNRARRSSASRRRSTTRCSRRSAA